MPLADCLPDGSTPGEDRYGAVVVHDRLGVALRVLPAGTHRIGMSTAEYAAAQRLSPAPNITLSEVTPVVDVPVPSDILIGDRPVTVRLARELAVDTPGGDLAQPAMLTREEAVEVADRLGCRLPREVEWEAACRAGSETLFPWGDDLPPPGELEAWLSWDIEGDSLRRNGLGLGGLFFGEWCEERYRPSHAADAEPEPDAYVVKGGGAQFWPWQDAQEWVWCAPAIRMPSTHLFDDRRCAARLVLPLAA